MAITANQTVKSKGESDIVDFGVTAAVHIYRNQIVGLASGYATNGGGTNVRAGIAREESDNTAAGAANGDTSVEAYTQGEFLLTGTGFTAADVGTAVYASDNFTITKTATANMLLGTVSEFVSATQVWVKLLPYGVLS